jgi:hypothetical protein
MWSPEASGIDLTAILVGFQPNFRVVDGFFLSLPPARALPLERAQAQQLLQK